MNLSKKKPPRYGLYGEKEFLLPDFIHCQTMAYSSEKHTGFIEPHVHTHLFQIFIVESGTINFQFDNYRQSVTNSSITSIPENTLHSLAVSTNIKGMILTISSSYLEMLLKSTPRILLELGSVHILNGLENKIQYNLAKQMIGDIYYELREELPEKGMVLQNYISLLLSSIYRICMEESEVTLKSDNRNTDFFRSFQRSMKQAYTPQKGINEYARELNITPVHLNRICQAIAGNSALQVVHGFLFLEAEKFLKHTNFSISEIAYRLNFEDPAYFSRFFSKLAGVSPKKYREINSL